MSMSRKCTPNKNCLIKKGKEYEQTRYEPSPDTKAR